MAYDVSDYETQGARARAEKPGGEWVAPPQLRAITWVGVAILVMAIVAFLIPFVEDHGTSRSVLSQRSSELTVMLAAIAASTAVILLSLRVVAGVILRAFSRE